MSQLKLARGSASAKAAEDQELVPEHGILDHQGFRSTGFGDCDEGTKQANKDQENPLHGARACSQTSRLTKSAIPYGSVGGLTMGSDPVRASRKATRSLCSLAFNPSGLMSGSKFGFGTPPALSNSTTASMLGAFPSCI